MSAILRCDELLSRTMNCRIWLPILHAILAVGKLSDLLLLNTDKFFGKDESRRVCFQQIILGSMENVLSHLKR